MNKAHHQGSVRCVCWHSSNPRIILSGGDDRSIRLWRLYPQNALYQSSANKTNSKRKTNENKSDNESDQDVELRYESDDDDDPTKFITDFDPSIQPISHLLSMPASGEVKALCMSPYNGEIIVATSSRKFNQRSSLDIIRIPHWTWHYSSKQRLPYRAQLRLAEKCRAKQENDIAIEDDDDESTLNLAINSLDDELQLDTGSGHNPFIENHISCSQLPQGIMRPNSNVSSDFVHRPSVIPLPYGARERCIAFSPSPHIVFVGLLSCRKKHQRRYCCLMACNISNGASRACKMMNALLHRKECIYCVKLTASNDEKKRYRLALGTNLGRLVVVTLKEDLSWINTQESFICEYTIGFKEDPTLQKSNSNKQSSSYDDNNNNNNNNNTGSQQEEYRNNGKKKRSSSNKHHRKLSSKSMKYSVLTSRERCFREMADPTTVMITFDSMKRYLWNESSQIEERDISEFFAFLGPNKKHQISFTQFVQKVDEDGNFMRAFEQFCLTGSSRTDRRAWMDGAGEDASSNGEDGGEEEDEKEAMQHDIEWEFAMLNDRGGDGLTDEYAVTALVWSGYDEWIISGHSNGDIRFWCKEERKVTGNKYLAQSAFYYVCRGEMRRHSQSISGLSLRGTYLVSSSLDGNILIWHLDFLLPSVSSLAMNISGSGAGAGIIQLLASINSAHLGDEISDVKLSSRASSHCHYMSAPVPDALYLLSSGADQNIRCRHVMEILRQQLTERILAESQSQQNHNHSHNPSDSDHGARDDDDDEDGSDFGATTYN